MSERATVLLEHHLKELKLPTFLREYGKVAGQCAAEGVDHPGYLLRLSELEMIDRCWQPAKVAHFETREIMGLMEVWRAP